VIVLVVLAFTLEDWGVDQSLVYSIAGTFTIIYGIWLMRKNGVSVDNLGELIATLVLYGVLGPVVHLVQSVYRFFTYKKPEPKYSMSGDFQGSIINIESDVESQNRR
jgi:hypothetical protein